MYRRRQTQDPPLEVWKPRLLTFSKETLWLVGHVTHIAAGVCAPVFAVLAVVATLDHLRLAWFFGGLSLVSLAWVVFLWLRGFRP